MRVERAFGFVDLCGFTEFTDRHDDASVVVVLASLRTALREAAARRGVRVVKWLGDGAMLSSTMPDALVALAIEIDIRMSVEAPPLPVRIGLAHGPVIMFEGDDYIGRAVNLAARLCDRAEPHDVLAAGDMATCGPPWVTNRSVGTTEVRGFRDPLEVWSLGLAPSDRPDAEPVVDPVCGLAIPRAMAIAGEDGASYCSPACAEAERVSVVSRP